MVLFGIIGLAVVGAAAYFTWQYYNAKALAESDATLRKWSDTTTISFSEKAEADRVAFSNKLEYASQLYKLGYSWTQAEASAGLPITTNSP